MPPKKLPVDPKQQSMLGFLHAATPRQAESSNLAASSSASTEPAPPPAEKRQRLDVQPEPEAQTADARRELLPRHRTMFPWIVHDPATNRVTCQTCQKAGLRTEWSQGKIGPGVGWKKDAFARHAR